MINDKNPIIFILPLSESLQKLKEVILEFQAQELEEGEVNEWADFELFDVDSAIEASQLIGSAGPSLIVSSSPKKFATILIGNTRFIKMNHSKVLLISPKELPIQIIKKFRKLGMTEHMVEPIPPKTLLHKIKLLCRSLPKIIEEETTKEMVTKVHSEYDQSIIKQDESQRIEKGIVIDSYMGRDTHKKRKDVDLVIVSDDPIDLPDPDIKTSMDLGAAQPVARRKDPELVFDIDPTAEKKKKDEKSESFKEDKKKIKKQEEFTLFDEDELAPKFKEKEYETSFDDDPMISKAAQDITLDLDMGVLSSKKKQELELSYEAPMPKKKLEELILEEEPIFKKKKEQEPEIIQTMMKSKVKVQEVELDIEDIELLTPDFDDDVSEEIEVKRAKKSMSEELELELEQDFKKNLEELELDMEMPKKKKAEELILEQEPLFKKKSGSEDEFVIEDAPKKKKNQDLEDLKLDFDDLEPKFMGDLEIEQAEPLLKKSKKSEDDVEEISLRTKKITAELDLELVDDLEPTFMDSDDELSDDMAFKKKTKKDEITLDLTTDKNPNLNIDDYATSMDDDIVKKRKKQAELELDHLASTKKKKDTDLIEKDNSDLYNIKKLKKQEEELEELARVKDGDLKLELEQEETEDNRPVQKVDHIVTKYGLKKKNAQVFHDWDRLGKKSSNEERFNFYFGKKKQVDIMFDKKVNRGEITIDYKKLKKEFDVLENWIKSGEWRKKEEIDSETKNSITYDGKSLNITGPDSIAEAELPPEFYGEDEEEGKDVIEPDSKGIEHTIETMNQYLNKEKNTKDILGFIARAIHKESKGFTVFYDNTKRTYIEVFNSFMEIGDVSSRGERVDKWTKIKEEKLESWKDKTLPGWHDHTFQEKENEFIYPYFEGGSNLGFAIVLLYDEFPEFKSKRIEVILEGARGVYLEHFHETGNRGEYKQINAVQEAMQKAGVASDQSSEEELTHTGKMLKGIFNKKKEEKAS